MKLSFVSLFPNLIKFYFDDSILLRAMKNELFSIDFINPRTYSPNKKVDDYKISGGAGLLMQVEPLYKALEAIKKNHLKAHFIFLSPCAKNFNQKDAKRLSKKEHLVFVCGRYDGIDERVIELFADEIFSIGDFVLTGGELGALVLSDAILRNVKGVLGNSLSLEDESHENNLLASPSFSKPFIFDTKDKKMPAISEFLKGNQAKIQALKQNLAISKTKFFRPDLFLKYKNKI